MTRKTPFRAGGTPSSTIGPVAEAAEAVTLLADVSEFQPEIADAAYLAWSKAIVIRALYGDAHDDNAWYGGQRRQFLHQGGAAFLGIYQYLVAGQDGAAQAQAFHSLVGAIQPGEVFIADFEEGSHALLTAWYNEMLALYGPGIHPYLWTYTGLAFGEAAGALPVEWIAAYWQPEPASPHRLWQFTDAFPVPGVGTADCSVFHGSIDQLAALAYQPEPAVWTYGAPRNLRATGGHTSVGLTWDAPAGEPVPDHYEVWVYEGTLCDKATDVPTYARYARSSPWQGGGLREGRVYTAHVAAYGPGNSHVKPGVFAAAVFATG